MNLCFTVTLCSGSIVPLKENGAQIRVTEETFNEWRSLMLARRMSEFDEAVSVCVCQSKGVIQIHDL